MADQVITGVTLDAQSKIRLVQLGGAVGAFDTIVQPTPTGKWLLADARDPSLAEPTHMMLEAGAQDEFKVAVELTGLMTILTSVAMVQATQYVQSRNPGKVCLQSDLLSADLLTQLWIVDDAAKSKVRIYGSGIAIP